MKVWKLGDSADH